MNKAARKEGERGIGIPSGKISFLLDGQNEDVHEKIHSYRFVVRHTNFDLGAIVIPFRRNWA